jgi:hypothetical protein
VLRFPWMVLETGVLAFVKQLRRDFFFFFFLFLKVSIYKLCSIFMY